MDIKINKKTFKKNVIPLAILTMLFINGFFFLFKDYVYNWKFPIKVLLDVGYPVGDAIYIIFLIYLHIKNRTMKNKILIIYLALFLQLLSDYVFLYQANIHTWSVGQINDYMYFLAYLLMTLGLFELNGHLEKILIK